MAPLKWKPNFVTISVNLARRVSLMGKYDSYVDEHVKAVKRSGYHQMSKEQQDVIQLMTIRTFYSFLESIDIVQQHLRHGNSLESIRKLYKLDDIK